MSRSDRLLPIDQPFGQGLFALRLGFKRRHARSPPLKADAGVHGPLRLRCHGSAATARGAAGGSCESLSRFA